MSKTYIDPATGEPYTLSDFCTNVAQLKRICAIPGITLERLLSPGYDHKPARTITKVMSREIMFSDGAYLTFPKAAEFSCQGDTVQWGRLFFRISLTPEAAKAHQEVAA